VIRISAGTAACLGLKKIKMDNSPTTAYLLWGEGCSMKCAFCPQGEEGETSDRLGRINWPAFSLHDLEDNMLQAEDAGIKRICLQSVRDGDSISSIPALLQGLTAFAQLPTCISAYVKDEEEVASLFQAGADRVSIALDVVNEEAYANLKGGSLANRKKLLYDCAHRWPGRISTHLICGLGETEEEMLSEINALLKENITVALFAFTPIKGTKLASHPRPDGSAYRRIQAAYYLLNQKQLSYFMLRFSEGRLVSFGLPPEQLLRTLQDGEAFRTTGCPDCNRPYYNERPGGFIYNYPRRLTQSEANEALACLMNSLQEGGDEDAGKMATYL
jgi:biotin synthase